MPKFTLPDTQSSEKFQKEQIQTQRIPQPLNQVPLAPIARPPMPFVYAVESMMTIHNPKSPVPEFLDIEDEDALILETVSMNTVKKVGDVRKVEKFFSGLFLLLMSILLLCVLAALFIIIPNLTYRCGIIIAFVISFSYIVSAQMKRFDRAHQKRILTAAQLARKGTASEIDDMMKHMQVVKIDTMIYLRAISDKDYRKRHHS